MTSLFEKKTPFSEFLRACLDAEASHGYGEPGLGEPGAEGAEFHALAAEGQSLAREVDAEELRREGYVDFLVGHGWVGRDGEGYFEEALAIWLETGILLGDETALSHDLPLHLALKEPSRFKGLASNSDWHRCGCEKGFAGLSGPGRLLAQIDPAAGLADARQKEKAWPRLARFRRALGNGWMEWAKQQEIQRLMDEADELGRLENLRQSGRGEAWLMHCLAFAPMARVEKALAAGLTLRLTSPRSAMRFFQAMKDQRPTALEREEWAIGGRRNDNSRMSADSGSLARWIAAGDEASEDLWRRWEAALAAGLPKIDWSAARPGDNGGLSASETSSLPLAILAQEFRRQGGPTREQALLWTRASMARPWFPALARLCGAQKDEPAMAWAFRNGLSPRWMSAKRFGEALSPQSSAEAIDETLEAMAQAGARLAGAGEAQGGWAAEALALSPEPERAARAMGLMNVDFSAKAPNGEGLACALARRKAGRALRAAMEEARRQRPGLARELMEARWEEGETALHWAAANADWGALDLARELGADVNARDNKGQGAFAWGGLRSSKKGQEACLRLIDWLDAQGYDWLAVDEKGRAPLARACADAGAEAIKRLAALEPRAMGLLDAKGKSWLDRLAERGGGFLALGESLALAAGVASETGALRAARRI